MKSFYYKYGPIETTKCFYHPVSEDILNQWVKDFKQLELEDYKVYLGGGYTINPTTTEDIDIAITGPIYDYIRLYNIIKKGYELALHKHRFFIDIKHFDNLNFSEYPKKVGFKRYHLMTELAGEEIKKIGDEIVFYSEHKTHIPNSDFIPKELAVNVVIFPMEKQIKRGKQMPMIRLI